MVDALCLEHDTATNSRKEWPQKSNSCERVTIQPQNKILKTPEALDKQREICVANSQIERLKFE